MLSSSSAEEGSLERNVWMGAYSIRPSGAARLLRLLQHSPPDVSRLVLDVWVARQVVDERAGLTACVWNTTNQIFQHGDERISLRRGFNGGIDRLGGDLLRLWRGGNDAAGHPLWLSRISFLLRRFDDVIGPLHTPKAACVRLKSCWMALGFWRCARWRVRAPSPPPSIRTPPTACADAHAPPSRRLLPAAEHAPCGALACAGAPRWVASRPSCSSACSVRTVRPSSTKSSSTPTAADCR